MGTRLPRYLVHGRTCEEVGLLEQSAPTGAVQCCARSAKAVPGDCRAERRVLAVSYTHLRAHETEADL
eukprot:3072583-Rhodomonas_salina.1